jgi:hypothetical protein
MEWINFLILVVAILVFLWDRNSIESISHSNKQHDSHIAGVQAAIIGLQSSWDEQTLQKILYIALGKYPEYQSDLVKAYYEQMDLLQGLKQGNSSAFSRIQQIIQERIKHCQSIDELNAKKILFTSLLNRYSSLNALFEAHRLKLQGKWKSSTNGYQKKKNLFDGCKSAEEIKKRFRRLAFLNHPDRGGKASAMKEIIRQYEDVTAKFR